jgi:predicted transcriptional regulator
MNSSPSLISVRINWNSLAKEAIVNCPKIKKDREKDILFTRFGLEGDSKTLQAIGNKHKITRERVRQIVNNGVSKIKTNCTTESTKKAIKKIEDNVIKNGGFATLDFLSLNLTDNTADQANGLKFIASLSNKMTYSQTTIENHEGFRLNTLKPKDIKNINDQVIKILKDKNKVMTTESLAKMVSREKSLVNASLSASNKLMKIQKDKWGLVSWPQINPKSIKDKSTYIMKSHGKPIHYHELSERITKMGTKKVTKQSVHNELIKNEDFILVGRGIYALAEWGYEPGIVEEVIVRVLEEAGEPLHKNIIIEKVLERRIVKPSTIVLNLQKPKFKKISKKVYTLN